MQFFKLLALAPVAASLVAATSLPLSGDPLNTDSLDSLKQVDSLKQFGDLANSNLLSSVLRRHDQVGHVKPKCNTKEIQELQSLISFHLDLHVTVDIISELCDKTHNQITEITADVDASVDVKVWAQIFVDLQATLEASLSVWSKLKSQGNSCNSKDLKDAREVLIQVFAKVQLVLEAYAKLDVTIQAELKVYFESFTSVVTKYTNTCVDVIVGIEVDIEVHVRAIICLLDAIRVQLSLDLKVQIDGLLTIGN